METNIGSKIFNNEEFQEYFDTFDNPNKYRDFLWDSWVEATKVERKKSKSLLDEVQNKTLVQMKLSTKTIERVESLKKITGIDNRTAIVAQSIGMCYDLLKSIKDGDQVIIERKNGNREILKFVI